MHIDCSRIHLFSHLQVKPKLVELGEGYGVMITVKQLDAAVTEGSNSATKLMRCLVSCFFPADVLGKSSAMGFRGKPPLDQDILGACICKSVCSLSPKI